MSAAVVTEADRAWPGPLPDSWEAVKLKYVAPIRNVKLSGKPDVLPYIGLEHVESWTGRVTVDETIEEVASTVNAFRKGDVLFGKLRPYLAKVVYAEMDGVCTSELLVFRPDDVDGRFLFYQLLSSGFVHAANALTYGAKMPRVSPEGVSNLPLAVPPTREEQRAIAAYLDRKTEAIDTLLAQKERQLGLLSATRRAVVAHVVTHGLNPDVPTRETGLPWLGAIPTHWDLTQVRYVSQSLQTGPFGSQLHAEEYVRDGWPVINPANLRNGRLVPDWSVTVDDETRGRLSHHTLRKGDVVFARRGELGRFGLVKEDEVGWLCGTGSLRMRPDQNSASSDFLFYLLDTPVVAQYLDARSVGATMSNLNTDILGRMPLPMPPRLEQFAIVEYLDHKLSDIAGADDSIARQIDLLRRYRQSVITAAVTGQLDIPAP